MSTYNDFNQFLKCAACKYTDKCCGCTWGVPNTAISKALIDVSVLVVFFIALLVYLG